LLEWLRFTGATFELLPKTGEYKALREELGWPARKAAQYIRNNIGTPPWLKKGTHAFEVDTFLPFYNIALRGIERNVKLTLGKVHAGGRMAWWYKWASTRGLWTVLKAMGAAGLLGAGIKEWYDLVGEQRKTNTDLIPLGIHQVGNRRKAVGISIPKSESTRVLDGLVYKGLVAILRPKGEDQRRVWQHVADTTSFLGGEVPGLNPWVSVPAGWAAAMSGRNFYDRFTGNPVLTRDEELLGGPRAAKKVLSWSLKTSGLASYFAYNPEAKTTLESVISLPGLSRALMVTDYGVRERREWAMEAADRNHALVRGWVKPEVLSAYQEYSRLRRITTDLRTDDEQERYMELANWYAREYSPAIDGALQALEEDGSAEMAKSYARDIETPE
jgi:hypothetical protein